MAYWKKATHPGAYTRKAMPVQKPGRSKQDYRTPPVLLAAVRHYLDIPDFWIDLAATTKNRVTRRYYGRQQDSLAPSVTWLGPDLKWAWLNPPFAAIAPWVHKAHEESLRGARIAILVPAAVGANWWRDWVHEKAHVLLLNGRVTFVGAAQGYPKDCAILLYGDRGPEARSGVQEWYRVWRWSNWGL